MGRMPNNRTSKCKVPETGMNVTFSTDRKEGIVAEGQATRRKGRWEMGCKAQKRAEKDHMGLKGYGKE